MRYPLIQAIIYLITSTICSADSLAWMTASVEGGAGNGGLRSGYTNLRGEINALFVLACSVASVSAAASYAVDFRPSTASVQSTLLKNFRLWVTNSIP